MPLARSRSASFSNRVTSSSVRLLLMGPSRFKFTEELPFQVDQFPGGSPTFATPTRLLGKALSAGDIEHANGKEQFAVGVPFLMEDIPEPRLIEPTGKFPFEVGMGLHQAGNLFQHL
jgi:hypothetical protein